MPAPQNDYQYCYLGTHNYIIEQDNLFDAYRDRGEENVTEDLAPEVIFTEFHLYIPIPNLHAEKFTNNY